MGKHRYRTTEVNNVNWQLIEECADKERVVFGIDVAKEKFVGALMNGDRAVIQTLKWRHPEQTRGLVEDLLKHLEPGCWCAFNFDHPCALNFDQGVDSWILGSSCG